MLLHPIPNIVKTFQIFRVCFSCISTDAQLNFLIFPTHLTSSPGDRNDPLPQKGRRAPSALRRHRFGSSSRPVGLGEKQLRHGAQGLKISEIIGKS